MKKQTKSLVGAVFGLFAGFAILGSMVWFLSSTINEELPSWLRTLVMVLPVILGAVLGYYKPLWNTFVYMLIVVALSLVSFFISFIVCGIIGMFLEVSALGWLIAVVIVGLLTPSGYVAIVIIGS